jgi:hypothetical protein
MQDQPRRIASARLTELSGDHAPKVDLPKQNLMVSIWIAYPHQLHAFDVAVNQWSLPHVEHLGKSRNSIVHGPGHTRRFNCASRRGRNGTFRRGRSDRRDRRGPTKRCYSWRVGKYVGRPQRGRQRRQGSRAAAAQNSPGDSTVQVIAKRVATVQPTSA